MKICFSLVLTTLLSLTSSSVLAAGNYDGIWTDTLGLNLFAPVTQNGSTLVMVVLDGTFLEWEAFIGPVNGSQASLSSLVTADNVSVQMVVNFSSPTSGVVTIVSCTPATLCDFNSGDMIPVVRAF